MIREPGFEWSALWQMKVSCSLFRLAGDVVPPTPYQSAPQNLMLSLFPDVLAPICSQQLIDANGPLTSVADLGRYRLIHVTTRRYAWHDWLQANGSSLNPDQDALYFGHFFMAMEAARSGKGVAVVPTVLLRHYEASRGLICPFKPQIRSAGISPALP